MDIKEVDKVDFFLIEFAEGRVNFKYFQNEYNANETIRQVLSSKEAIDIVRKYFETTLNYCNFMKKYKYNLVEYFASLNWESKEDMSEVHWAIWDYYLTAKGFKLKKYNKYINASWKERDDEMRKRDPYFDFRTDWVFLENNEIEKILKEVPSKIQGRTAKIKWFKQRIKELFFSESSYPRWIQDPEWPIVNGKPLVFKGQKMERGSELVQFIFYDPDTGKETIIEQFY